MSRVWFPGAIALRQSVHDSPGDRSTGRRTKGASETFAGVLPQHLNTQRKSQRNQEAKATRTGNVYVYPPHHHTLSLNLAVEASCFYIIEEIIAIRFGDRTAIRTPFSLHHNLATRLACWKFWFWVVLKSASRHHNCAVSFQLNENR